MPKYLSWKIYNMYILSLGHITDNPPKTHFLNQIPQRIKGSIFSVKIHYRIQNQT